jgi:hypothetical protein
MERELIFAHGGKLSLDSIHAELVELYVNAAPVRMFRVYSIPFCLW